MKFTDLKYFRFQEILLVCYHSITKNKKALRFYLEEIFQFKQLIEYLKQKNIKSKRTEEYIGFKTKYLNEDLSILLRKNTSDIKVYEQVFDFFEYQKISQILNGESFKNQIVIFDLGSNIGLTSLYFYYTLKNCFIISVEPDIENYKTLVSNIKINKLNKFIKPVNRAIWTNSDEVLMIDNTFRDGDSWSKRVRKADILFTNQVKGISISELADNYSIHGVVHLLKIDIEGTEFILFNSNEFIDFLKSKVLFLCLEIHEEIDDKSKILECLLSNNFEVSFFSETFICKNKNLNSIGV